MTGEDEQNSSRTFGKPVTEQFSEVRLLRSILKKISDRGGFLIEEKLLKILEPYTDEEKCLVRIDNIFNALKIIEYKDITSLIDYFVPYSWCPNCSTDLPNETVKELTDYDESLNPAHGILALEEEKVLNVASSSSVSDICYVSDDDIERNITTILASKKRSTEVDEKNEKNICTGHYLVIKPAFVLTALRSFTDKYFKKHEAALLGTFERHVVRNSTTDRVMARDSMENCWPAFLQVMPEENRKLWKTLEHGLNHYLEFLKEREQLDINCEFLRRQNTELRHLLQKHLTSNI